MATVLIVDDHPSTRDALCRLFQGRGHVALSAASGEEAIEVGRRLRPDAAVVDLVLPTLDGFDAFGALKTQRPDLLGIAISGVLPEHEVQERCQGAGFAVFLSKHSDLSKLVEIVERALGLAPAESGPPASEPELGCSIGMIGRCPAMVDVYWRIARIAPTPLTVLIEGETGTGKELVARGIHTLSRRCQGPFVAVNSAGVPREILESELFGSERGAFTDAVTRDGVFERASGGTLFLDEIADLSASAQAVLLRVLDQRVVSRLGGRREIPVNVRVIAATNARLRAAARDGRFRQDLYHRLAQSSVHLPPLRARVDDVQLLAEAFLERLCRTLQGEPKRLSASASSVLRDHSWPGNVRELQNVLSQACLLAPADVIDGEHILAAMGREESGAGYSVPARPAGVTLAEALQRVAEAAERQWIIEALAKAGTRKNAARELGIDVKTLYRKMEIYRISPPGAEA